MHQSIDLTRPRPGFNALLVACSPGGGGGGFNKMSVNRGHGAAHTARAITGSGDNSRDLTRRTEGRTIAKVMGGVGKKSGEGG